MTLAPIIGREMRVAARLRGTYWLRFAAAALALVISGFLILTTWGRPMFETGRLIYVAVSWMTFLVCLLSGLWLTCDSLSEEKREGTLGLLFLTDLRGYHVVIGKLAANSLTALLCVLAVVPILAMTLLMGGITAMEVARMALALATALHFSLCSGLLISSLCHSSRKAFFLTFALIFGLTALAPILGGIWAENFEASNLTPVFFVVSSGCAMVFAGASEYAREPWLYWVSIGVGQLLGCLFLAAACRIIPHRWQEKSATIREDSWRGHWHRFWMGGARWRKQFRLKALAQNPYYWLTSRGRWGRLLAWSPLLITAGIWYWGWYEDRLNWFIADTFVTTMICLGGCLKVWVATRAGQNLGEARRLGVLELFLTAPLSARQILAGQWRSLARFFFWPLLVFLAGVWMCMVWDVTDTRRLEFDHVFAPIFYLARGLDSEMKAWKYVVYAIVFVADLLTLGWLCQWLSLRFARPHRSTVLACLLVLLVPWLVWGMLSVLLGLGMDLLQRSGWVRYETWPWRWIQHSPLQTFMLFWLFICLAWDGLLLWYARWRLTKYFRVVAATPVGMWPVYRVRQPKPVPPVIA